MQKKKIIYLIIAILLFIILTSIVCLVSLFSLYPNKYSNLIEKNLSNITINNNSLTKNFILSVIQNESSFKENAKSSKDAYGLMQLTYPTALEQAKKLNIDILLEDLFNPEINIKLGVNYLNYLFTIFDDKQLVILSYNAGFNKVKSWIENKELNIKNGVYQSPYKETNNYIIKILRGEKIYNFLETIR